MYCHVANEFPKLFGDLYGGAAFGDVNTSTTATNLTTTVDVLNGTIDGAVYGGGLGRKADAGNNVSAIEAIVYGVVHVNIGKDLSATNTIGKATLINCSVYGCNNQNGSPQQEVYVDVYQTAHIATGGIDNTVNGDDYAIHQLFGGGNRANYTINGKKTNVYIHHCDNTIQRVFGGGNAADVYGIEIQFDGGHFDEFFGGGNGEVSEAGVGAGIEHRSTRGRADHAGGIVHEGGLRQEVLGSAIGGSIRGILIDRGSCLGVHTLEIR